MTTKQAIETVKRTVETCDHAKYLDLVAIMELGAGNMFLTDKTAEAKRDSIIMELVDAVAQSTFNKDDEYQPDAEFVPCRSGHWELVLAGLVIDQDWSCIAETADDLRDRHEEDAARCPAFIYEHRRQINLFSRATGSHRPATDEDVSDAKLGDHR